MAGRVWVPLERLVPIPADPRWAIIFELRLPRTILAIAVGAALGTVRRGHAGLHPQPAGRSRRLGVSSMAALGAVLTLYLGAGASRALGDRRGRPWSAPSAAGPAAAGPGGPASSIVTFILAGVILQTDGRRRRGAGAQPRPQPLGGERDRQLADGLAGRPQPRRGAAAPCRCIAVGCVLLLTIGRARWTP